MATRRIREFLDGNNARYVMIHHSPAFTASEVAASVHVPGKQLAKSVMVKIDGQLAIAVVPATRDVDFELLRSETGARDVRIAEEPDFVECFEGCQLGAMPPFGDLFGFGTYVERSLAKEKYIAFNAGTHTDVIVMEFNDYRRLARPKLAHIDADAGELKLYTAQI
jgi:Ala-tRNA(Pro) deacylase